MPTQLQRESSVLSAIREVLESGASGRRAVDAWTSLVSETALLTLFHLDEWERRIRTELWHAERRPPSPRWKFWHRSERFASWLDLCSADGFRRERILRSASGRAPNGFFFALALRRLNDWVPEVRAAAREILPRVAECSEAEQVVDALWYSLAHCGSWGRMEEADRQLLVELTSIGTVASVLSGRIRSAAAGPAAHVLAQAGRGPALDPYLTEFASAAVQPSVRAKAYRCLLEERMVWIAGRRWRWTEIQWCKGRFEPVIAERALPKTGRLLELLTNAVNDRSAFVRRVAADFVISRPDIVRTKAPAFAARLAKDANATVAERGRYLVALLDKSS